MVSNCLRRLTNKVGVKARGGKRDTRYSRLLSGRQVSASQLSSTRDGADKRLRHSASKPCQNNNSEEQKTPRLAHLSILSPNSYILECWIVLSLKKKHIFMGKKWRIMILVFCCWWTPTGRCVTMKLHQRVDFQFPRWFLACFIFFLNVEKCDTGLTFLKKYLICRLKRLDLLPSPSNLVSRFVMNDGCNLDDEDV